MIRNIRILSILLPLLAGAVPSFAMEGPWFVTYDHHLEEPGNLEVALSGTWGIPGSDQQGFIAPYLELEYGATAWWTTELYFEGQSTRGDSTIFTGWRFENRFRPLAREHRINTVLYIEYESINEASRIMKDIVGNAPEFGATNDELRQITAHELEAKVILSGSLHDWTLAGNVAFEKNLSEDEGVEFGYALGASRPLGSLASAGDCRFCPENFSAGLELYGGLGSTEGFGLHDTAQYLAPSIAWETGDNSSLRFSLAAGLTEGSLPLLVRFGYSYEFRGVGRNARGHGGVGK